MATIVIADDKGSNRQFLTTLFGYFGHRVLEAEDGRQALALTRAEHPDLVFTDILMPEMDGLELARRIRADPALAAVPIIFYTATYRGSGFKALAHDLGVDQVIAKPSEPQAILDAVGSALQAAPSVLSDDPDIRIHAAPQNRLTEQFLTTVEDLGATVLRLNSTIELAIDLIRERDPARLAQTFCRGAQDIIGARYAACGMPGPDGSGMAHLYTCGLPPETVDLLRREARTGRLFRWMLAKRSVDRRRIVKGDPRRVGLPAEHPWITTFLGIPIHRSEGEPGWLYLAEKFGAAQFSDEDARIGSILAWEAGVAFQNTYLHHEAAKHKVELERQAAALRAEIAERERTERQQVNLERQLLQAQKMEALGTLAGGMAHDINNCLVPILSLTELVREALPTGSRQQGCMDLIGAAGGRIRDLVKRILVFSRREESVIAPLDLTAIFADSVNLLRATLPATIDLRVRGTVASAVVEGDAGQMQQVLLNLCVNAADAIGDGTGGIIELSLERADVAEPLEAIDGPIAPGRYFRLRASDNGCGMDEATLARIFEPFYTTKEPGKGTGLGLAIVHTIVQSHGGRLRVISRLAAGTTFEIYLPESDGELREC